MKNIRDCGLCVCICSTAESMEAILLLVKGVV